MTFVDSHCHLEYEGLVERQEEALAAARSRGVGAFLNISTKQDEWASVIATAHRTDDVYASVGIHPHHADTHGDLSEATLDEAAADERVIGIGETGLDYYYDKSDRILQQRLFRIHIAVSRRHGLPLIVHTRDAEDDTLSILRDEMGKGAFPALIHCFTASVTFGRAVMELGLSVSLSGIVTFKNAKELQAFASEIPDDRLLIETDSPFLAPVPHRGKACEPAFVVDTAAQIAKLRGVTVEEIGRTTTANFRRLFRKAGL